MKVILLQDVPKVGRKYDTKNVSDGYGRNFLVGRGLALLGTAENEKRIAEKRKVAEAERKVSDELLRKNIEALSSVKLEFKRKANEEGHLFAGIKREEIKEALQTQANLNVPVENIELKQPIKSVGEYKVSASMNELSGEFTVSVVAEA